MRRNKYGNKRTNGFASKKEARRYNELVLLQRAGRIDELRTQVPYKLEVNGMLICKYIADFVYSEVRRGAVTEWMRGAIEKHEVVEDAKGMRTPLYRLKAKLMKALHGITIRET